MVEQGEEVTNTKNAMIMLRKMMMILDVFDRLRGSRFCVKRVTSLCLIVYRPSLLTFASL
jgi:hypothetical protein